MNDLIDSVLVEKNRELIKYYSDKLEFLWEKYLTLIHFMITLSGGTVLIFFNSIKIWEVNNRNGNLFAIAAVECAVISLAFSILWRFITQYLMEQEIFGSEKEVEKYYKICNIDSVAVAHHKSRFHAIYKFFYRISPYIAVIFLFASWVSIFFFITGYNS